MAASVSSEPYYSPRTNSYVEAITTQMDPSLDRGEHARHPASRQEERDNQVYWAVWIRWPGTLKLQRYKALVDTGAQCTLVLSNHKGTESITISDVTGGSQQLTLLELK